MSKEDKKILGTGSNIVKAYRAKKMGALIKRVEFLQEQLKTEEGMKLDDYKIIKDQIDDLYKKIKDFS